MQYRPALGAVLVLAALVSTSTAGDADPQPDGRPLRVGVITSLTGAAAAFGQAHKYGYTIAASALNAKGGILGRKLKVLYYDDQSKPDQAVQGVAKLVDQDHVPIVLGAYSSETTRAIIPAVTQKGIPLIMPTATADNVVETGSPWVFRICAGANAYAQAMAEFLQRNGAPRTIAIVYENTNFGQANAKAMASAAPAAGMTIVAQEGYQAASPDYKALLQRVKAVHPEVVYFASYLLDATTLMRQAEQVELDPRFFTAAGTGFSAAEFPTEKGAGKYAEYTFSVSQWLPSARWAGSKEFDDAYLELAGSHPAYHGMQAYAALLVAASAIEAARSDQPAAIADAIRKQHIDTPFGPIAFDARGQNAHPVLITQVQGGQYKVVWPADVAEGQLRPTPTWSERAAGAGAGRTQAAAQSRLWSLVQAVLSGLLTGSLYALIGMGMALIFGVMRIVNFAHGAFMMLGMYAAYVLFDRVGVSPYVGFIVSAALLFAVGIGVYQTLLRRVADRSDFMQILLTLGIAQIIIGGVQVVFHGDFLQVNLPLRSINLRLGAQIAINLGDLLAFLITAVLALGMFLVVMKTRFGRALRAIAQNRYAASLMGIDVRRTQAVAFGLGLAAVGMAGGLLLPAFYLYPEVGGQFTLKSFVIVVLGGMGSVEGAAIAGLVLGVIESLTSLYWGNEWALVVDFALFLLVLSVKPTGLFGSQRV